MNLTIRELATGIEIITAALVICGFIRFILKPVLRLVCIIRLRQLERDLEQICESRGFAPNSFAANFVRTWIRGLIRNANVIGLSNFIHFLTARKGRPKAAAPIELQNFTQTAPKELRDIFDYAGRLSLILMGANSLGWLIPCLVVYRAIKLLGVQEAVKEEVDTFVEKRMEIDLEHCAHAA